MTILNKKFSILLGASLTLNVKPESITAIQIYFGNYLMLELK